MIALARVQSLSCLMMPPLSCDLTILKRKFSTTSFPGYRCPRFAEESLLNGIQTKPPDLREVRTITAT